jgi:hypothetical protein
MSDQLKYNWTNTHCGVGAGRSENRFIIEPDTATVVEHEDAMFGDCIVDDNVLHVAGYDAGAGGFSGVPHGVRSNSS